MPPLFKTRSPGMQIVLGNVVPAVFGLIVGIALGVSAAVYAALSLIGAIGGFLAGLEHDTPRDGATRGFAGGLTFGAFLVLGHELSGLDDKTHVPTAAVLVAITTLAGIALGVMGALLRARRERAAFARRPS